MKKNTFITFLALQKASNCSLTNRPQHIYVFSAGDMLLKRGEVKKRVTFWQQLEQSSQVSKERITGVLFADKRCLIGFQVVNKSYFGAVYSPPWDRARHA